MTNKQIRGKKRSNMVVLGWTKYDKYMQQEHKLSVFFIKSENTKKAFKSENLVTYHFIATINKGEVLHLSSPFLNSSTTHLESQKKNRLGRNKKDLGKILHRNPSEVMHIFIFHGNKLEITILIEGVLLV